MLNNRKYLKSIILFIIVLLLVTCKGESTNDFIDKKSGVNFSEIMKNYSGLKELNNKELKIKGGGTHSYEVKDKDKKIIRANAMIEVFSQRTPKGMDLTDFSTRLKTYEWIRYEYFTVIENLGGELPIKNVPGNTHAVIRFAGKPLHNIALYFRIKEAATKDEIYFYLKSEQPMDNTVQLRKFKIVEAVLFMEVSDEKEIVNLSNMKQIEDSASISGNDYDPVTLLKSANKLIDLGKEEAIQQLRQYLKYSNDKPDSVQSAFKSQERVILLCRILFEPQSNKKFRAPMLGAPVLFSKSLNESDWKLLPLEFVDGIPFLMVNGYLLRGQPETGEMYLDYCIENANWHGKKYLIPNKDSFNKALSKLYKKINVDDPNIKQFLQDQVERINKK